MSTPERSAIEAEARRLRETLESIDETFVLVGADWRIRDMNTATQTLDGRPAAQIIGRDLFAVWPGILGSPSEAAYRGVMATRVPATVTHHYVDQCHDLWLDTRIFPSGEGLALFTRDITQRVRMEQRLREVEADAAVAVQAARLGTWLYLPQTGALFWNARHRALFGLAEDAPVTYAVLLDGIHPDDRVAVDEAVSAALAPDGPGTIAIEYRLRPVQGEPVRWLSAQGQAQFEGGRCVRLTGVVEDVTERRRGQAILEESEARFRAVAEATPMIVFVSRPDVGNIYANPQYTAFCGIPSEQLRGAGWRVVVHPEDLPLVTGAWMEARAERRMYEIQVRLRRHDGVYRWFLIRCLPLLDPHATAPQAETAIEWFGTATDIQDLVEARQVLARDRDELEALVAERTAALNETVLRVHESEARLRAVFENSSDYLSLFQVDSVRGPVCLDLNERVAAALGRRREEVIGLSVAEVHGDSAVGAEVRAQLDRALAQPFVPYRSASKRRYAGEWRNVENTTLAFDGPRGERLLLVSGRDVTEQTALEEALRQSQKMEAIGQLTGGIAHDFNNLLAGISGSVELMRDRVAQGRPEMIDRYAGAALDQVRRAAALTHRLLAFARRQALDPRPADLNRLVAGMEEMIRRAVGPAIEVRTRLAPDLWPTLCDANQLENALLNLCINARDAMPDGGAIIIETGNVTLGTAEAVPGEMEPGEYAAVAVADSGVGMAPETVARVFEPFFTTKPAGQGTGLGLSMLYGFVRQSGGHVAIDSAPGRGTTVRLFLPRFVGAVAADPAGEDEARRPPAGATRTVLVVEDETLIRTLAVEVMAELGHTVLEAADGPEALRLLGERPRIDLLLTDVGLPGMNGRELAETARARQPDLPVLFMTGYAHNSALGHDRLDDGMELIGKPFALEALVAKVRAMLVN